MSQFRSDVAFTSAVKAEQEKRGSRTSYDKMAGKRDWPGTASDDLKAFIAERNSFYLATANSDGQPYIQHRGGPKGFLKVLDEHTLAIADFSGNRQYITIGNLAENDRACIFLMDYIGRQRIKIWGRARIAEDDQGLLDRVSDSSYTSRIERVIVFTITAWDTNCPQHITPRYDEKTIGLATKKLGQRVSELEAENERLKKQLAAATR